MRIALFDPLPDGGHQAFLAEPLAAAFAELGHEVLVLRPEGSLQDPDPRPMRVAVPATERHQRVVRSMAAGARSCATGHRAARAFGSDVFVDLELDARVLNRWIRPRGFRDVVHVVHGATQLAEGFGRDHAFKGVLTAFRNAAWRRALTGATVVTFRPSAVESIERFEPRAQIHLAGYPVVEQRHVTDAARIPGPTTMSPLRVLMAGQMRPDKRPDDVIAALAATGIPTVLDIAGPGSSMVTGLDDTPNLEVRVRDGHHTEAEFAQLHREAHMVTAIIPGSFDAEARVRGTLLKGVGYGVPVLTTPPALLQLPEGYPAVTAASSAPGDLAAAITTHLGRLPVMRAEAERIGPAFVLANHTYDSFARALVAITTPPRDHQS
ncbi:MAG: hypothetical protein RIE08_06555 [Acidimicrobiales bacterium]